MKKVLLALLMLTASIGIFAQGISEEQARLTAADFIAGNVQNGSRRKASMTDRGLRLAWSPTYKSDTPEIYVFNLPDESGFVIVSGDESTSRQVLGWSDKGSFDPEALPQSLQYLSAQYVADIASLREEYNNDSDVRSKICKAPTSGFGKVDPLLTTHWNQTGGYNDLLPAFPTGCVATALAQIMNYHQWPVHGYGKHTNSYMADQGFDQTVDFSQSVYDWEGMKNNNSAAISKLMYDVGCAVNMHYTPNESGAKESSPLKALVTNFGYDESTIRFRLGHSDNTLRDEIRNGRPVFYAGSDTITEIIWIDATHPVRRRISESHAFVCDGFSDDGLFHFNFGWGGIGDGYYTLDVIRPLGENDLKNSYGPSASMIFGIQPGEKTCIDGVWYDLNDDTGTATIGSGSYEGDVTIPQEVTYAGKTYRVAAMYEYAFTELPEDKNVITNLTFNADIEEFPAQLIRIGTMPGHVQHVTFGGGVRRIADRAFYEMRDLQSATFGDNIEFIGKEAFYNCTLLEDLTLSKSLKEISDYAFSGCKINNLDVPKSVKRIGKYGVSGIFYNVKINGPLELDTCAIGAYDQIYNLEGLEHCTHIAYYGIYGATGTFMPNPNATYDRYAISGKFDKIIIPASCTKYDYSTALETKEFYVEPENPNYASSGGALYTKDLKTLLALPILLDDGTYSSFSRYVPMGVTEMTDQPADHSYYYLYLPPSLQRIRASKIGGYNLRHIYCMNSVPPVFDDDKQTEIQLNAYLHVPVGSEEAYAAAPVWSKVPNIIGDLYTDNQYIYTNEGDIAKVIGRRVEAFTGHDFMVPSLVEIDGQKLPVTTLESSVFQGDPAVESVTLGSFIEWITKESFKSCSNLKRVKLEGDIYDISDRAFENCTSLEKVDIPRNNHLTNFGEKIFLGCSSLKSIDVTSLEDYFMNFGNSIFEGCTSLRSAKGLSNVHTLTARTFANSGIESFHIGPDMYSFDDDSPFDGCRNLHTFTVSPENDYFYAVDGVLYYYKEWTQYPWRMLICPEKEVKDGRIAERSVINISERCQLLTTRFPATVKEVIIPSTVNRIDWRVFYDAAGLQKVTVLRNDPDFVSGDLFNKITYSTATLQVPKGAKEAYSSHHEWKQFTNIVEIDPDDYPSPETIKAQQEALLNAEDDPSIGNALVIFMQNGDTHFLHLVRQPVITINGSKEIKISGHNIGLSLPIADIKYYRFDTYDTAGIEAVADDSKVDLYFTDGNLRVKGLKSGQRVQLYDLQGRLIRDAKVGTDGALDMTLNDLPTAVYVLKVNDTTYKIMK